MKTIKTNTVEYVVLDDGERLKSSTLLSRSGTGWQGQLFLETIKNTNGAWHTGETDGNGGMLVRIPSVDEVIDRAVELVEKTVTAMEKHGWSVEMATADDLLDQGGGRPGFVVNNVHGKADQGGPPLPAAKRPTEAFGRPGHSWDFR